MKSLSLFPSLFDDVLIHDKKNLQWQFASWQNQTNYWMLAYFWTSLLLGMDEDFWQKMKVVDNLSGFP